VESFNGRLCDERLNANWFTSSGHGGDQQGVSSVLYLLPDRQFGVVILSNLEHS
jgi:hypothetical protein